MPYDDQYAPALARGTFRDSLLDDPRYMADWKHDGVRELAYIEDVSHLQTDPPHVIRLHGRRMSKLQGQLSDISAKVLHLSEACLGVDLEHDPKILRAMAGLAGTVVDGELVLHPDVLEAGYAKGEIYGGLSKYVMRALGSTPEKSRILQRTPLSGGGVGKPLVHTVFDCLRWCGQDICDQPLRIRREYAYRYVQAMDHPYVRYTECADAHKRDFLARVAASHGEGIILKDLAAPYGKRSAWIKYKFFATYDCVLIGVEQATETSVKVSGERSVTKFWDKGWIGKIVIGQYRDGYIWECGRASGFADETRAAISSDPEMYIGRTVTIKAWGREPSGLFRHPQFVGWSDKPADECIYDANES